MILCLAWAGMIFTGCNDSKDGNATILKPIEENLIGKWQQTHLYQVANGVQTEVPQEEADGLIVTFRTDGTALLQTTKVAGGQTFLNVEQWNVDNKSETLNMGEALHVSQLDNETLKTSTVQEGISRSFARIGDTQPTLAEQLAAGRWVFVNTWEKKNGQWQNYDADDTDETWYEFREDGTMVVYARQGDKERPVVDGYTWSVDIEKSMLYAYKHGEVLEPSVKIEIDADGNLVMYYTDSYNMETEQYTHGEFKDVFALQQPAM